MRHASLTQFTLAALLGLCGGNPAPRSQMPARNTIHTYAASAGNFTASTLVIEDAPEGQRIAGVTHFSDGTCLAEEAAIDRDGRLARAEYAVSNTHVALDPARGTVTISTAAGQDHIQVPNDLPWVWTPVLQPAQNARPVSTPLAALVTLRAAQAANAVRSIQLGTRTSHRDLSNQLLVKDHDQSDLVVVGEDVVTIEHGLPTKWHVWALDQDVQAKQSALGLLSMLGTFACTPGSAT